MAHQRFFPRLGLLWLTVECQSTPIRSLTGKEVRDSAWEFFTDQFDLAAIHGWPKSDGIREEKSYERNQRG